MMTILYREGAVSFNRLKKIIEGSDGAVYAHLQKLEVASYIVQKKEIVGNKAQTVYSLSKEGKKQFRYYIKFLEQVVSEI